MPAAEGRPTETGEGALPLSSCYRSAVVASPCTNICQIETETGLCRGCLRTLSEIACWSAASERQQQTILRTVARRRRAIDRLRDGGLARRLSAALRQALQAANRLRRRARRAIGLDDHGVHAIALTPDDRLILVRLTYANGWFCPGGGKKRRESPCDGVLRELREEIGIRSWRSIEHLGHFFDGAVPPARADAFLVRDVAYRPRWSLEIAEVRTFALDALPPDLSEPARIFLAAALARL